MLESILDRQFGTSSSPTYRFVDGVSRGGHPSSAMTHYDRSSQQPMGLVKQAYSAWVQLSSNARPRKWHLTACVRICESAKKVTDVDSNADTSHIQISERSRQSTRILCYGRYQCHPAYIVAGRRDPERTHRTLLVDHPPRRHRCIRSSRDTIQDTCYRLCTQLSATSTGYIHRKPPHTLQGQQRTNV